MRLTTARSSIAITRKGGEGPLCCRCLSKSNTYLDRFRLLSFRQRRQQGVQIASSHAKVHRRIIFAHIRQAAYCGSQRPAQCT